MAAEDVARALQERFLSGGNFILAGNSGAIAERAGPVAANADAFEGEFEEQGFAGLAVQAVGYEQGVENPKVHVYITKGSNQAQRTIGEGDEAVQIQISRVGKVTVRPEAAATATNHGHVFIHQGRIACGSSCAPAIERYAGTLGALVRLNGALYILSNNHVLGACNHTPSGAPILSPSARDGGPNVPPPLAIARHFRIVELRSGAPDFVNPCQEDVALAQVIDGARLTSQQGSGPESYDTPAQTAVPVSGMRVKKFGRTTGLTAGTIESKALPFAVPYKSSFFTATVWFNDVWVVRADPGEPFVLAGDSGSLVVDEAGVRSIGLVFAATPKGDFGYVVPIGHVLTCLGGPTLVQGHNV